MNFLKCSFNIHWFSLYQNIWLFLQLLQIVRECFFGFFHENSLIKNSRLFFLLSWVREEKAVYQSHKGGKKKKKKYIQIKALRSVLDACGFWLCLYKSKDSSSTCSIRTYLKAILWCSQKAYMVWIIIPKTDTKIALDVSQLNIA